MGPEDRWCEACTCWKPPLASHCSICGRCCLWMDHHCNFAAQCIGFKNIRCFLLMQWYTQALLYSIAPLLLRRLWMYPLPWTDWWAAAKLISTCFAWYKLRQLVRYYLPSVLGKVSNGWPSLVLLTKFEDVASYEIEF